MGWVGGLVGWRVFDVIIGSSVMSSDMRVVVMRNCGWRMAGGKGSKGGVRKTI